MVDELLDMGEGGKGWGVLDRGERGRGWVLPEVLPTEVTTGLALDPPISAAESHTWCQLYMQFAPCYEYTRQLTQHGMIYRTTIAFVYSTAQQYVQINSRFTYT